MIAWKLTTEFDKQRHLFFEKIQTDYIVETYICSCGHTDFITKHPEQKLKYICIECENTKFYGYSIRIHQQQSIIYGVFRAEELLYAIELNGFRIVQAKAVSNNVVPSEDMSIINGWKNNSLMITQT